MISTPNRRLTRSGQSDTIAKRNVPLYSLFAFLGCVLIFLEDRRTVFLLHRSDHGYLYGNKTEGWDQAS